MIENRPLCKTMVFRTTNMVFREGNIWYYLIIVINRMSKKGININCFLIILYHHTKIFTKIICSGNTINQIVRELRLLEICKDVVLDINKFS